jgi:hypothetical protein
MFIPVHVQHDVTTMFIPVHVQHDVTKMFILFLYLLIINNSYNQFQLYLYIVYIKEKMF